ncbi:la-related protein 1-like [Teratosphaeria destructans]|uniref:La-related protein 1-like n=1 Tax=Teratosphaeria destructans TaxID=418781 RepID=A0A9W7SW61_9PEZI|nr:la-related protein 1-like [Teratosphaeria destructans]
MAAATSSPSGFSYAQAAKGRSSAASASQAPPSKANSGTATPATTVTELPPSSNWADDVEASAAEKTAEAPKSVAEPNKGAQAKDSAVERAKLEDKAQQSASGTSSPVLSASAGTSTKDDASSNEPTNGGSETTWESKSQDSEPAWIVARKERQVTSQTTTDEQPKEGVGKKGKKSKESSVPPAPKPVLTEAAPPPVNIWAKRAEEAKAKVNAQQPAPKPAQVSTSVVAAHKENQRPPSRKKANSITGLPQQSSNPASEKPAPSKKFAEQQQKRPNEIRITGNKLSSEKTSSNGTSRASIPTHSSLPNISTGAPPSVRDEVSWPTPDTAQEKERRGSVGKDSKTSPEKPTEEATPSTKAHKKREWQSMVVTPNIIFETQGIRNRDARGGPSGERGSRGSVRGRGGFRGGGNGGPGRINSSNEDEGNTTGRGRAGTAGRDAMPPPNKHHRASSASSFRNQSSDARPERGPRGNSIAESRQYNKAAKNGDDRKPSWKEGQSPVARTVSPAKIDSTASRAQEGERHPESPSRRNSVGTQTENAAEQTDTTTRDPPVRMVPSDTRREARSFESFKENGFPSRGGKRGGRGRGGSRDFVNGHQASHPYTNGDFASVAAYNGVPASPSFQRGGHQLPFSQPGRGGWSRGSSRAPSIALESYYARGYGSPYGHQLPPVQAGFMPGMYDYNGYPVSAMPYPGAMMEQYLLDMVNTQIDYYFSIDNLLKDMFLRKHMDSQGFVFLDFIAGFNRIKGLTQDRDLLRVVCINNSNIEIRRGEDGKERLRKKEGWEQFLLPMDQRDPSAQNEGPKQLERPEGLAMYTAGQQLRGSLPPGAPGMPRFDRRSYDGGYPAMNGYTPSFTGYAAGPESGFGDANGEDARGRPAKSPIHNGIPPTSQPLYSTEADKDAEPDAFQDDQLQALTVIVKPMQRPGPHSAASRTFSNGSIDSRSIFGELEKKQDAPTTNGESLGNGAESTVGSPRKSLDAARSPSRAETETQIQWSKDLPSGLRDGVTGEAYTQLRYKALDQRANASTGNCPYDLDVLYQFWAHFLLRNFNSRMYNEFKYFANEDARERRNLTGLQNLLKFYDHALLSHSTIRDLVINDYLKLVNDEPQALEGAAFKQLRSAWRNGAMALKNRKKLADILEEPLKQRLET